jgi:excisionase family DNA binding protein
MGKGKESGEGVKLLSITEAAQELKMHRAYVWTLIQKGRLRATKAGYGWVIEQADLDDFQARQQEIARLRNPS